MNDPNVRNEFDFNQLKGPELKIKVFLELKDFYLGKELEVMVEKQVVCPHCHGSGAENSYDIVPCKECGGKGRVTQRVELGGGYYNLYTQVCNKCQGKGKVIGRKCHVCHSSKIIPGIEEFKLKVQPGTESNSDLRYTNMGDERMQGAPSDIVFELV